MAGMGREADRQGRGRLQTVRFLAGWTDNGQKLELTSRRPVYRTWDSDLHYARNLRRYSDGDRPTIMWNTFRNALPSV